MSPTRSQMDAQLAALYGRIPSIPDCNGRCWTSCGPVDMSGRERQRIRAAGIRITPYQDAITRTDTFWCDALTSEKRCAVYELRPLVCRLWGAVEGMKCPFGCIPEGGWMSDAEAYELIAESMQIGGVPAAGVRRGDLAAALSRPEVAAAVEQIRRRGRAGDALRARHAVPAAFRTVAAEPETMKK